MAQLDREARMTIEALSQRGVSNRETARLLNVTEGTVRYHRRRQVLGLTDGRARQRALAADFQEAITSYLAASDQGTPCNIAALHTWLVAEFDYPGSLRSLERYVRRHYPAPPRRARRRVETPPGAQAQVDWAVYPRVWMGGTPQTLLAFEMQLSWSRYAVQVWSTHKHQLAWLDAHNEAFRRLGGIPATLRVDNEKTAVIHGAGAWGVLNPTYRRYAQGLRFHIDACPPRAPQAKAKASYCTLCG